MICVVVPTLNAGDLWEPWIDAFESQSLRPGRVLVVDSGSEDRTVALAEAAGLEVLRIRKKEFNHGGTRQLAAEILSDADILIYLTQDALIADPDALEDLVAAFDDPSVGAAYGRQLPHLDAGPIAAHARCFNYGGNFEVRSFADASRLGIKAAFLSNSFTAYRRSALMEVGGFPSNVILGEDQYVGAKLLLAGWKLAYCPDAKVRHSHDYTWLQEFRRYFDIGVFYSREEWIGMSFGKAEGEGKRFVLSEMAYLFHNSPWLIPSAILRTVLKYFGYRLGMMENRLPLSLKRSISMHKMFWNAENSQKNAG